MPSMPGPPALDVLSREVTHACINFDFERMRLGLASVIVLPGLGSSSWVHLSLFERAPTQRHGPICRQLELRGGHAVARPARLLTDHRLEVVSGKKRLPTK